jgi:hypothetical protein
MDRAFVIAPRRLIAFAAQALSATCIQKTIGGRLLGHVDGRTRGFQHGFVRREVRLDLLAAIA